MAHGIIEHRSIQQLTRAIQLFKFAGDHVRLVVPLGQQQLQAELRIGNATRRVQARREHEAHASGGERFSFESRRADQRPQTRVRRFGQQLETVTHHDAILAAQRCDISNRGQRHEIELTVRQRR